MRRNRHNPAYVAVALTCATAALPSIGIAAEKNVTDTGKAATAVALDADSCSAAFATVMASYLKPEIDKQFPGDTAAIAEFTRMHSTSKTSTPPIISVYATALQ